MEIYVNSNPKALFSAVEFTPQGNTTTAFFYTTPQQGAALRDYLTQTPGQTISAHTNVQGKEVLVTSASQSQEGLMQLLAAHGDRLTEAIPKKTFQPWKWRGGLNMVGQGLTLGSGYFQQGGLNAPKLIFAGTNILASCINMIFGAQKSEDVHHLRALKTQFNDRFSPYLSDEAQRANQQDIAQTRPSEARGIKSFIARHSVRYGEMGLRYFASVALTFPVKSWGRGLSTLVSEGPKAALRVARNPENNSFYAGLVYLIGKTIGLLSKVPDPYNPKPPGLLDRLCENVFFRLSSAIETGAALKLAYGSFTSGNITVNSKQYRDIPGGVGGLFLAGGLATRYFAPFGEREVNMPALEHYLVNSLAQIAPETLPQLLAETAASLKNELGDKAPALARIYTDLARGVEEKRKSVTRRDIPKRIVNAMQPPTHLERLLKQTAAAEPERSYP